MINDYRSFLYAAVIFIYSVVSNRTSGLWAHICVSCAHAELQNWFSTHIAVRYSVFCSVIVAEY